MALQLNRRNKSLGERAATARISEVTDSKRSYIFTDDEVDIKPYVESVATAVLEESELVVPPLVEDIVADDIYVVNSVIAEPIAEPKFEQEQVIIEEHEPTVISDALIKEEIDKYKLHASDTTYLDYIRWSGYGHYELHYKDVVIYNSHVDNRVEVFFERAYLRVGTRRYPYHYTRIFCK